MKLVIADTGPIAVKKELSHPDSPDPVRSWIAAPPQWLEIRHSTAPGAVAGLDVGETKAITLAIELHADLLLMDERRGVKVARGKGIEVTGTLGVLSLAGQNGMINLAEAFDRIKRTTFRYSQDVMDRFLEQGAGER